jgi:hypothetical protein
MPSRFFILLIVGFWLVMAAWLFRRDVWPRLQSDEPTPYVITLVDEPRISLLRRRGRNREVETRWALHLNEKNNVPGNSGSVVTQIEFAEGDDALAFSCEFRVMAEDRKEPLIYTASACRVNWDGELLGVVGQLAERRWVPGAGLKDELDVILNFVAPVERGYLMPLWYEGPEERAGEPAPLSPRGGVLVLVHPMNRLPGLHVGQRWRLPQIDLMACLGPGGARDAIRLVEGVVGEDVLRWRSLGEVACFVIDYHGDEQTRARTWVRKSDGLVLQQEFTHGVTRYIIERSEYR